MDEEYKGYTLIPMSDGIHIRDSKGKELAYVSLYQRQAGAIRFYGYKQIHDWIDRGCSKEERLRPDWDLEKWIMVWAEVEKNPEGNACEREIGTPDKDLGEQARVIWDKHGTVDSFLFE